MLPAIDLGRELELSSGIDTHTHSHVSVCLGVMSLAFFQLAR